MPIEGVVSLPVTKGIKCLRGVCNERLKYEVEYSLKQGTSENSYLLQVRARGRWRLRGLRCDGSGEGLRESVATVSARAPSVGARRPATSDQACGRGCALLPLLRRAPATTC